MDPPVRASSADATTGGNALLTAFAVAREVVVRVSTLGLIRFVAGEYAYAGKGHASASPRVGPPRAHVDYALAIATGDPRRCAAVDADACALAARLARLPGALPVIGIGTSGCECLTHLYGFISPDAPPAWDAFAGARP